MLDWVSEGELLPRVGEVVLVAFPRQTGKFWDIRTARLLVKYEEVMPSPVKPGGRWPTNYYWSCDHWNRDTALVTGNGWWASLTCIPLPPGAEHRSGPLGDHYVAQIGDVFVSQGPAA